MKNNNFVLLKNLLLSTSSLNKYKYCKDKKKRGKIVGTAVGSVILYLLLMAYCIANCVGFGMFGLTGSIPVMCATVISALAFVFTFMKTNGYLFGFKEYDMLMSLPFEAKSVAACKFLYMYIKSLPWYMSVSVSMMVGYGIYAKPSALVYPVWVILSLFLPVIPMLGAAFLGFLIAKLGSGFKNKNIAQTVITIIFVLACFALRFFLEDMFRNNKTEAVMNSLSEATGAAGRVYLPIEWFSGAVSGLVISDILLLIGVTVLLFEVIFIPVGRSYRKINSALGSHTAAGKYVMEKQKGRSVLGSIVFKEFKRMTGSSTYMVNAAIGELFCIIAGIAVLFIDIDKALHSMLQNAPITKEMLFPAIPFLVYFFTGMVSTPAFSPSLEGKNYWIVQSLPLSKKTLYQGKMLFNIYLTVPFALFATVTLCISSKAPLLNSVLYVILILSLSAYSTAWGCVCGVKHLHLDWENEIDVIKQGSGSTSYVLPNMFLTIILIPLVVYLGTKTDPNLVTAAAIILTSLLAVLSYMKVMSMCKEK